MNIVANGPRPANSHPVERLDPATVFADGLKNHHIANTAYPIAHTKTIWHHRASADRHEGLLRREFGGAEPMCLYAHIPFCERRCAFCEYSVIEGADRGSDELYHRALLRELASHTACSGLRGKPLAGFDIGGGTPMLVDARHIGALVDAVTGTFRLTEGFAMSIETTPRIAATEPDRLAACRAHGIERISMGLQMVNPRLLRVYGRELNDVGHNRKAVDNIRRAGFRALNIDVMYGFAKQSPDDFVATLESTVELAPEVITLYRMRYKGTRIEGEASAVEHERVALLQGLARATLLAAGYHANPGKNAFTRDPSAAGTSAYLTQRVVNGMPYLGIGLGAQTFTGRLLGYNHGAASKRMDQYLRAALAGSLPVQDLYDLPPAEGMAKMIAVAFYFGEVDTAAFARRFGVALEVAFPREVAFVRERGLMAPVGDKLRLTEAGATVFPGVIALFYSDAVKTHLHGLCND